MAAAHIAHTRQLLHDFNPLRYTILRRHRSAVLCRPDIAGSSSSVSGAQRTYLQRHQFGSTVESGPLLQLALAYRRATFEESVISSHRLLLEGERPMDPER